jgi:hypothetical protein
VTGWVAINADFVTRSSIASAQPCSSWFAPGVGGASPIPREWHAMVFYGGQVMLFGGYVWAVVDHVAEFAAAAEPISCSTDLQCAQLLTNVCMCKRCNLGMCSICSVEFGNVNCRGPANQANWDDILCLLAGFGGFAKCPNGDIHPPCTGNNIINLDDILAELVAFGGGDPCDCSP